MSAFFRAGEPQPVLYDSLTSRSRANLCNRYLALKHGFSDEEPRRRIFTLTTPIMNELSSSNAASGAVHIRA